MWCSWKYIICSFSCVNIAGSLVKQGDKLSWERKCCLFSETSEKVCRHSWKMCSSLGPRQWAYWRGRRPTGGHVLGRLHLSPSAVSYDHREQDTFTGSDLKQRQILDLALILTSLDPFNWALSTASVWKCALICPTNALFSSLLYWNQRTNHTLEEKSQRNFSFSYYNKLIFVFYNFFIINDCKIFVIINFLFLVSIKLYSF